MINKILASIVFILLLFICYCRYELYVSKKDNTNLITKNVQLEEQVTNLKDQVKNLTTTLEKSNNDILEINKRQKALEQAIKNDTSNFNWNFDISTSTPVVQLQKQCLSCS